MARGEENPGAMSIATPGVTDVLASVLVYGDYIAVAPVLAMHLGALV